MGEEVIHRNLTVKGGITATSDLTFEGMSASSDLDVIGNLQVDGNITSSGSMTIDNAVTASSAFKISLTVAATSNTIPAYGLTHITNASTVKTYNLATATTGAVVYITAISMATTDLGAKVIPTTTDIVFLSSGGSSGRQALFGLSGDRVTLVGNTSGNWIVTNNEGVVFSAS